MMCRSAITFKTNPSIMFFSMKRIPALLYTSVFLLHSRRSSGYIRIPSQSSGVSSHYSQPAGFGNPIDPSYDVYAHLQNINDDEYLCGGEHDLSPTDYTNNYGLFETSEESSPTLLASDVELSAFNLTSDDFISKDLLKKNHFGVDNGTQEGKLKNKLTGKPKKKSSIIEPPDDLPGTYLQQKSHAFFSTS